MTNPVLNLKAVEARLAELLSQPDGVLSTLHESNHEARALLALLRETRAALLDVSSHPSIPCWCDFVTNTRITARHAPSCQRAAAVLTKALDGR